MPGPLSRDDAAYVFSIEAPETIIITPDIYVDGYEGVEQRVLELKAQMARDFENAPIRSKPRAYG